MKIKETVVLSYICESCNTEYNDLTDVSICEVCNKDICDDDKCWKFNCQVKDCGIKVCENCSKLENETGEVVCINCFKKHGFKEFNLEEQMQKEKLQGE